jgi:hypothetical protein
MFFICNISYIKFQQNVVNKIDKHNYIHYRNVIIKPIHQIEPLKVKHVIFEVCWWGTLNVRFGDHVHHSTIFKGGN